MALSALRDFALVGGTALSLRYGHRRSVDLDLFAYGDLDRSRITDELAKEFGAAFDFRRDQIKWAAFCNIDGVKVDIVKDPHPRITDIEIVDGIRMYSDADIAPMKIEAILHRARKKDFWDLEELLRAHGLQWIMDHHRRKYPDNSIAISIPFAITWFVEAEDDVDPVSLQNQTWESVKRSIGAQVNGHTR